MECLLVLLAFMITIFSFDTNALQNYYVTPNKATECSDDRSTCLILEEYAGQPDEYFINDTIFHLEPGSHRLNSSLNFTNVHNFTLQGLPNSEVVDVLLDPLVTVTWKNCSDIEVSSISFSLLDYFTYGIVFEHSHFVQLSNISVFGNEFIGCSSIISQYSTLGIQDSLFVGIQGSFGAVIMIYRSCMIFSGNNLFLDNSASFGGSLYIFESVVTLSGTNTFMNNTSSDRISDCTYSLDDDNTIDFGSGGAIYCESSTLVINSEYSMFISNSAEWFGGAIAAGGGNVTILGSISFVKNAAQFIFGGGAISLFFVTLTLGGNISFINNEALLGGALYILESHLILSDQEVSWLNNVRSFYMAATMLCGCWNVATNGVFTRSSYSHNNYCSPFVDIISLNIEGEIGYDGASDSFFSNNFKRIVEFHGNSADRGGAIYSNINSNIIVDGNTYITFENNRATNDGGAIYLGSTSKLILSPNTKGISFTRNHADNTGGALYVKDSQCSLGSTLPTECFLSIYYSNCNNSDNATRNISLLFLNNSAKSTGSTLYGGQLNKCRLYYRTNYSVDKCGNRACNGYSDDVLGIFMNMSKIIQYDESNTISSQAEKIKLCQDEKNILDNDTLHLSVYPGEQFNITVIALDQSDSPVPTTVFNENRYTDDEYRLSPSSQSMSDSSCTNISFQLYSAHENTSGHFQLYPDTICQSLAKDLSVNLRIFVLPCPLGFKLSEDHHCHCNSKLSKFTTKCYIHKSAVIIKRLKNNFWISLFNNNTILIHEFRCPLDYCIDSAESVTLSDPSVQCDFNRDGILCGKCQKNFSLALGSLHCIPCSDKYVALILILSMAGITLIAIIFLFHLTVAVGTLNGLIFYANIIQANHQAFFPRDTINFFTVFISWLNLDLGIETCFYDGMDIYAYSWFQFLFPFYLWFLICCIILACRYSRSIAKRLGHNPVAILATLLLMSYSKILQAVIAPLSLTYLTYYSSKSESHRLIWLYDGSIEFFKEPKHIVLGLFSIFIQIFFVVPYISLLLFGHWLQGCSNWWILSWLNKIKPFMDAYHAPYKKRTRFWTGLLLLSRLGLFLTFAINANGSESVNILAISSISIALLAIQRRIYEHWLKDLLESSFIFNLGIFSVVTFYLKEESEDDKSQLILSSISVGIAFITFIGILLFHVSLVLKSSSIWNIHMLPFIQKSLFFSTILRITPVKGKPIAGDKDATELQAKPTSTEVDVDLREPLLEITESQAAA